MKSSLNCRQVFGKDLLPGYLLFWSNIQTMDLVLSVEHRKTCVYVWVLTSELLVEQFPINYDLLYGVATPDKT